MAGLGNLMMMMMLLMMMMRPALRFQKPGTFSCCKFRNITCMTEASLIQSVTVSLSPRPP
jgi:hypothetical protein